MSYNDTLNYFEQPGSGNDNVANFNGTFNIGGTVNNTGTSNNSGTINSTATLYSSKQVQTLISTVTLAQSNAGQIILPAVTGKTITITDFQAKVNGNYATTTAVVLEDTNGTPVVISTLAVAALTTGAFLNSNTSGVAMGAGYFVPLTLSKGLQVVNSGSAATGGTSIIFKIDYVIS